MSLFESASLVVTPNGTKASKLYAIKPTDGSGDLSVTRATTATRVNSSGLIESVATNVPRLDYTNSSCPSILVEPQRTNLLLRSEEFENSYFSKLASSISVNSTTSPNNTITADKLVEDTSASAHRFISTSFATTSGTSYSVSIFLKRAEREYAYIRLNNSGGDIIAANINLLNGTVSQLIFGTITIIPYDNDWYRVIATGTSISTSNGSFEVRISNSPTYANYTGNGTSGIYIWGAQLEAGENATSYIPTTTASVTRNADVISKTGISSLIGQTEGTVLCDINLTKLSEGKGLFAIDNGTTNEYIALIRISTNIFRLRLKNSSGAAVTLINSIVINDARCKVGIAYKNGDYAMYVNGVLRGTSTNSTNYPTTTLTQFILSNASYGQLNDSYNISALWKTRLSNTELATLTTI